MTRTVSHETQPVGNRLRAPSFREGGKLALLLILSWHLATFIIAISAYSLLPSNETGSGDGGRYPEPETAILRPFTNWDASHYLYLADNGYEADSRSNVFSPALPFSIHAVDLAVGDTVVAGLIVVNLASIGALYLFFAFTRSQFGPAVATRSLLLLLAFPTAFFLNLIYTEGLFLLLTMVFLVCYERRFSLAAAAALLLPLVRAIGVLMVVPFLLYLARDAWNGPWNNPVAAKDRWRRLITPRLLYAFAPLAGYGLVHAYMLLATGDAFAAEHAASLFSTERSVINLLDFDLFLGNLFDPNLTGPSNHTLDRLLFLGFLASLPIVYRYVDKPIFAIYALVGLVPLLGSFESYARYLMLAFPLYIAGARLLAGRGPLLLGAILVPMILIETRSIVLYSLKYWVA